MSISPSEKTCTYCGVVKPLTEFYAHSGYSGRLRSECKACVSARSKAHAAANPEKRAVTKRKASLKYCYGMSLEQYDERLIAQGGGCAICGETCGTGRRLAVDHHHGTGEVRGLLCSDHNTSLGKFKDSPGLLSKAISYLAKSGQLLTTEELADLLLHQSQ